MFIKTERIPIKKIIMIGLLPSFIKKQIYRLKGYKIGKNVSFGIGSILDIKEKCVIGDDCVFGFFSIISGNEFRIGKRCKIQAMTIIIVNKTTIGNDVIISETAIIRTAQPFPDSEIIIDDRAHIFPYTIIDPSKRIYIGKETAVGFSSYIFTHSAYKNKLDGYPVVYGSVSLGKAVWIPCNVFIMPGVTLGDDVVVGTGSIVTKSYEAGSFILGQPAKLIKTREQFAKSYTDEEKFEILNDITLEYIEYIKHFGKAVVAQIDDTKYKISINSSKAILELHYNGESIFDINRNMILLIFKKISDEDITRLNRGKCSWFNPGRYQCSAYLSDIAEIFKDYLGRYGIYFERP
jgi:acetyltransferase-like isoleucine patch superfamily enzyme